jgi:hypothetical protein
MKTIKYYIFSIIAFFILTLNANAQGTAHLYSDPDTSDYPYVKMEMKIFGEDGLPMSDDQLIHQNITLFNEDYSVSPNYIIDEIEAKKSAPMSIIIVIDIQETDYNLLKEHYLKFMRNLFKIVDGNDQIKILGWGDTIVEIYNSNVIDTTAILNNILNVHTQTGLRYKAIYNSNFKITDYANSSISNKSVIFIGGGTEQSYYDGLDYSTDIPNILNEFNNNGIKTFNLTVHNFIGNTYVPFNEITGTQICTYDDEFNIGEMPDVINFQIKCYPKSWSLVHLKISTLALTQINTDDNTNFYSLLNITAPFLNFQAEQISVPKRTPLSNVAKDNSANNNFSVNVYPNPSSEYITINDNDNSMWKIYDINGKYVSNIMSNQMTKHNLHNGIYTLINNNHSIKFIVQ